MIAMQNTRFPPTEGSVKIGSITLYYKMLGKGRPVLVLHGGPGMNHTYFLPHMEILARTCTLIFYDQRGCGKSSAVTNSQLTLRNYIEDIEGIRKAFNLEKLNILGHSWGGLLAMYYSSEYYENVNSLILVDPAPASSDLFAEYHEIKLTRIREEDRKALEEIVYSEGFWNGNPRVIENFFIVSERVNFYNRTLSSKFSITFDEKEAKHVFTVNRLMGRYFTNYDIHEALSQIQCPTLVIYGDYDCEPVEAGQKICEHIEGSQLVILEKCGHYPFIESPEEFSRIVKEFLDKI